MYPAQTSLIPATVALARFLEANGAGGLYPYWYLGTTPLKYLSGPVVPYLLVFLKKVIPVFSYFELSFVLIFAGFFVEATGWGMLAGFLAKNKKIGLAVGFLSLIMPWHIVSALGFAETSAVVAGSLTPWVLLAFVWGPVSRFLPADARSGLKLGRNQKDNAELRVVGNPSHSSLSLRAHPSESKTTTATPLSLSSMVNGQWSIVFSVVAFAILLLTNTTASVSAIIGLFLLSVIGFRLSDNGQSVSQLTGQQKTDNLENRLKRAILIILLGWLLTLWWYSPGYWLTVWGAPGIGGKNVFGVLSTFINFMRGFLPVIAAMLFVFWKVKPKTVFEKFSLGWLVLFGSLTLFRFMADWDFWMDWTTWIGEVEVGIALLSAVWIQDSRFKIQDLKAGISINPKSLIMILLFLSGWFLAWQNRGFWLPRTEISNTVEYKIAKWLELNTGPVSRFPPASARSDQGLNIDRQDNPDLRAGVSPSHSSLSLRAHPSESKTTTATRSLDGPAIFLSGSTAFWLNSLVDVKQVRGGHDESSVDPKWREAVWEVREGESGRDSVDILKSLGVDYLVVHTDESSEYYHDFKYPEKFEGRQDLEKVYDDQGDTVYKVSGI